MHLRVVSPTIPNAGGPKSAARRRLLAALTAGVLGLGLSGLAAPSHFVSTASASPSASAAPASLPAPGCEVPESVVRSRPIAEWFRIEPIPDAVFKRMQGKSFKADCTVPREDLRYVTVLHRGADGAAYRGEMVVNRLAAEDVRAVFLELFEAAYPIERMVLIDEYGADDEKSMTANNTSAFNFRFVRGTKKLSNHAEGFAVDLNPLYNPLVYRGGKGLVVDPAAARPYADRDGIFPFKIDADDLAVKCFKARGWIWGGDWKSRKDWQHFEKKTSTRR